MRASGTAQHENQATPSASSQTVVQLDPEVERHRKTAGTTDSGEFADYARDENSSVFHEKTETTRVGDDQAKETGLQGSEGLNGQDTAGHEKGGVFPAMEKQPPGKGGNKAQGQQASSLPPCPSSGDVLGQPAGENTRPHQNVGIPPRPVSWVAAIKAAGAGERRLPQARAEKQSEMSSSSRSVFSSRVGRSTKSESSKLSAAASAAAATAAAVLRGDLRTKSESAVSADVGVSCHEEHSMTQDNPGSSQHSHATALAAPIATAGEVEGVRLRSVSGENRRSTPVRGRIFFASRESQAQRKGAGFIHYFKGPLRSAGAKRANSNEVTPKGAPPAHAPTRDRTPSSTPGTRRKATAPFSNPGAWRPRSIPMRRSYDTSIQPERAREGEGQIQTAGAPSGISEMTAVAGSKRTAIPTMDVGDAGHVDNADTHNSRNLNDDAMRPESAAVVSTEGEGEGGATEEENRDGDPSVAPEELVGDEQEEDAQGMEEKEEIVEVGEMEGDGEEPEAVVSESCSFTGRLKCGRSLRVEGSFAGELVSTGSVTIGPTGTVTGDLDKIKFLLVDGQLTGNVMCDTVVIGKVGKVFGNITSESITVGPQATMRGMLNVVEDIAQARAEALPLELQAGHGTLEAKSVAGNVEPSTAETHNNEENDEVLKSAVKQGGAGAEQAAAVEAEPELKAKAGATDAEHENEPVLVECGNGQDQKPRDSSSPPDSGNVLQPQGRPAGEGGAGDLEVFDAASEARAAEAEAKAAEEEAKAAVAEAMIARADTRATEAEVPSSSENPG